MHYVKFYKQDYEYLYNPPLRPTKTARGHRLAIMKEEDGVFYFHPVSLDCYEDFIKYDDTEKPDLTGWTECDKIDADRILNLLKKRKSNLRYNLSFFQR